MQGSQRRTFGNVLFNGIVNTCLLDSDRRIAIINERKMRINIPIQSALPDRQLNCRFCLQVPPMILACAVGRAPRAETSECS